MDPRLELLNQIRAIQFMAVELNLYLNTHPSDQRAINDYNCYTQEVMRLRDEFERCYGLMTNFGYSYNSQCPWSWIKEPWPWEQDFPMEGY